MELLGPALRHQVLMEDRPLSRTSCSCEPIRGHNPLPGKQRIGAAQYWQAEGLGTLCGKQMLLTR